MMVSPLLRRLAVYAALIALPVVPQATLAAEPFTLNVILPLSGFGAFLGKSEQAALGVAEDVINKQGGINGRPVHFVYSDDQSTPQLGLQLLTRLLETHPPIVLGSTLTAICGAMASAVKDGPVMWCFSPAYHPAPDGWVYASGIPAADSIAASARYLHGRAWDKIAILASTDTSGADAERSFDNALALPATAGAHVVAREHFALGDISVAAQVARIKAAEPQAVYAMTSGAAFGTILHGLADAGFNVPVMTMSSNESFAEMKQFASVLPQQLFFASVPMFSPQALPNGPVKRAIATYQTAFQAHNVEPDTGGNQTWDMAFIVIGALRKLGTDVSPAKLRAYLDDLHGYAGINGVYDFHTYPKDGVGANWAMIQRWDPSSQTFAGASRAGGAPL